MNRTSNELISITEVAKRSGFSSSALRYYEEIGLLKKAQKQGGRRVYAPSVLRKLSLIQFAKSAGWRLDEIRSLVEATPAEQGAHGIWRQQAQAKLAELDALIVQAEQMKRQINSGLECGCRSWAECGLFD